MKKVLMSLCLVLLVVVFVSCGNNANIGETENIEDGGVAESVESTETEVDTSDSIATITALGRASVRIEFADDTVVYIDPFAGTDEDYEMPADLVLVTHQHGDHNKVEKVTLKEDGKIIMCPDDIGAGDTTEFKGIEINAVAAYNKKHAPNLGCGYIIKVGELVFYHTGDTSYVPEMEELHEYNIDYAFITMDGIWNMDHVEAKLVADTVKAGTIIPIHTGAGDWNQETADAFDHENKVVLKPGESLEIK